MRLNPLKYAFGVFSKQFLGHIVSIRGIEPTLTQIKSLSEIKKPKTIRNIQNLTRKIAALSRFISRMSNKCKPFFRSNK